MPTLRDCILLHGPDLNPIHCKTFAWQDDHVTEIAVGDPAPTLPAPSLVVIPGLYNGHTHVGDGALPDGAAGLTLEEGFFRPHGYKYRELGKLTPAELREHMTNTLQFMARTGTVAHLDFREQGAEGAQLLREASNNTGIDSIILNQFNESPFDEATLDAGTASLPASALAELEAMLAIADGFSESTMNDLTPRAWREIRERTAATGQLRAIHCLENPAYRDISMRRNGRGDLARALDTTDYDADLIVHLTLANAAEIKLMAESGRTAALNPRANATLGLPLPPVTALLDAGARLLLGTDNVMLTPPNLFAELDFTHRLARSQATEARPSVPPPVDILRMVTSNIRPLLGGDHYGYLDVGLPASFVVLDFTAPHLRHTRNLLASIVGRVGTADILATYHRGRELWRSAELSF
ncbi:amidohydrolase family protein [Actomonas aquatica]|uniref:Amidohydrolase family protein n=1 Tax=Actomonas aquatica TaxID=2866162 RepID=A0ABZ1CB34_9BACT|nr:amidohydrolase family protein [Opitutus sp. WL0086]WRQ88904.1 amidohydrolase family protein [Opitutus sp. WL0086]